MQSDTLQWTALARLNRARLLVAGGVLLSGALLHYTDTFPFRFGPFASVVGAMALACTLLPLARSRIADPRRVARGQVLVDVALVTAVVAVSGASRSIFVPLYVLAVVAACFVLPRPGPVLVAALSSLLYVGLVVGRIGMVLIGWAPPDPTMPLEVLTVLLNATVLLIVAVVIGSLAERYGRSQDRLEAQKKRLSDLQAFRDLIFESVGSGLVAVDPIGRITAFNRAAESITGVEAGDALGRPWEAIFGSGIDLTGVGCAARTEHGFPPRYEFPLLRRDGREVPVGISFWALRSGRGEVQGLIGVCQDLSLIKQMEQRVRQADRLAAVGRLSANMAHEIRNPLASISGAVEALTKDLPPDEQRNRLVEIVQRESERLNHLVGDFLAYARPAPITPIEVEITELLEEVALLFDHRSMAADVKIVREYGEGLLARVDPQQMRQAIWNLYVNAAQAMPEGGEIRVGAAEAPGAGPEQLQIWIADTGDGIPEHDLPHIFEPFYSTKPEGSGLGLALVYRVVQDHGGQIDVRSRVGEGTTFTLTLPAAATAKAELCPS